MRMPGRTWRDQLSRPVNPARALTHRYSDFTEE